MTLNLNTAARLQHNWQFLTYEEIATLEIDGVIKKEIQHNSNLNGRGVLYTGLVQAWAVWVHVESNEVIADASPRESTEVLPEHVYAALDTGIALSSAAQVLLATVNGGTMPNILPPVVPEPEDGPIVDPEL